MDGNSQNLLIYSSLIHKRPKKLNLYQENTKDYLNMFKMILRKLRQMGRITLAEGR